MQISQVSNSKKGVQISSLVDVISIMALVKKSDRLIVAKGEKAARKKQLELLKFLILVIISCFWVTNNGFLGKNNLLANF